MSSHRELMPTVTAWIDNLRAAFGDEVINVSIRAGMAGKPKFWASENGVELGSRQTAEISANAYSVDFEAVEARIRFSKQR